MVDFPYLSWFTKKTEEIAVRLETIWKDSLVKFKTSKNIGDSIFVKVVAS
jgi:hypothetical protein